MINFDLESFKQQVKETVIKRVKGIVTNAPTDCQIPVVQLERKIMEISDVIQSRLSQDLAEIFGVNVKSIDVSAIEVDKESAGWIELRKVTADQQAKTIEKQTDVNLKNLEDTQRINASNMEDTLRIQREEAQRAQRLQTESNFMGAHALDQQTAVLSAAANNLGQMSNVGGGNGGLNPAGMMIGMMMGGAMGSQMAGMMNNMGQQMQQSANTPPPIPTVMYHIAVNGAQSGPFNLQQLAQMVQTGQFTPKTYVWKQGMASWDLAENQPDLANLFAPPVPGSMPPPPPTL